MRRAVWGSIAQARRERRGEWGNAGGNNNTENKQASRDRRRDVFCTRRFFLLPQAPFFTMSFCMSWQAAFNLKGKAIRTRFGSREGESHNVTTNTKEKGPRQALRSCPWSARTSQPTVTQSPFPQCPEDNPWPVLTSARPLTAGGKLWTGGSFATRVGFGTQYHFSRQCLLVASSPLTVNDRYQPSRPTGRPEQTLANIDDLIKYCCSD